MALFRGDRVRQPFVVTEADMACFQELSGDSSRIHVDANYARQRGFRDRIVYGGIMLAKLSYVLGAKIPGDEGVSVQWSVTFRNALYVGEEAEIRLEVTDVSSATGLVQGVFSITAMDRRIAEGKIQSIVPIQE